MTHLPLAAAPPRNTVSRVALRLLWLVISVAGFVTLSAAILHNARDYQESRIANEKIFSIGWGLSNYIEKHGRFPPAFVRGPDGNPWHSWRVLILPYIDADRGKDFYKLYRFDEPWNSPNNLAAANRGCRYYGKRMTTLDWVRGTPRDEIHSTYFALVGRHTVFGLTQSLTKEQLDENRNRELVVVESPIRAVLWTEPVDIDVDAPGAYEAIWGDDLRGSSCSVFRGLRANRHRIETLSIPKNERLSRARILKQ